MSTGSNRFEWPSPTRRAESVVKTDRRSSPCMRARAVHLAVYVTGTHGRLRRAGIVRGRERLELARGVDRVGGRGERRLEIPDPGASVDRRELVVLLPGARIGSLTEVIGMRRT